MDNSTIGIKIADGTYFPVLEEDASGKKRLILTTVNDDQESVQIDLYKGSGKELRDALYIGSLVIEDIMPAMKGEPEIELVIGIDSDGNLNAVAGDAGSEDKQSLSVSLESLDDGGIGLPNFELDENVFGDVPSLDETDSDDEDIFSEDGFDEEDIEDDIFDEDMPEAGGDETVDLPDFDDEFGEVEDEEPVFEQTPSLDDDASFGEISADDYETDETDSFDGFNDEELSFDEDSSFDDDLSSDEEPSPDEDSDIQDNPFGESDDSVFESQSEKYEKETVRKRGPVALVVILLIVLAIIGIGAFLVIRGMKGDSVPALEADRSVVGDEMIAEAEPESPAAEQNIVAEAEPAPPVMSEEVEPAESAADVGAGETETSPIPETASTPEAAKPGPQISYNEVPPAGHGGGVWYRLKWGDTLWDLSNSFYRTPWLYGLIAVENNIKNPDIIYAGTDIIIPEN